MKRTVTLQIAGAKYRMVSDADDAHLHALATLINDRIQSLNTKTGSQTVSMTQLLAMTALTLADELLTLRNKHEAQEETLREALTHAIERIDVTLAALEEDKREPSVNISPS